MIPYFFQENVLSLLHPIYSIINHKLSLKIKLKLPQIDSNSRIKFAPLPQENSWPAKYSG